MRALSTRRSAIVEAYESCASPLDQMMEENEHHSHILTDVRDTLLPKLISGELRVPDAQTIVGRHV